jgi:hypothetical protein
MPDGLSIVERLAALSAQDDIDLADAVAAVSGGIASKGAERNAAAVETMVLTGVDPDKYAVIMPSYFKLKQFEARQAMQAKRLEMQQQQFEAQQAQQAKLDALAIRRETAEVELLEQAAQRGRNQKSGYQGNKPKPQIVVAQATPVAPAVTPATP